MTDQPEIAEEAVTFRYTKSGSYRLFHVDGAIGGVTGRGQLNVSLYSERIPLPDHTTASLDADGNLIQEFVESPAETLVREVEVTAVLDLETAQELHDWLSERIFDLRQMSHEGGTRQSAAE